MGGEAEEMRWEEAEVLEKRGPDAAVRVAAADGERCWGHEAGAVPVGSQGEGGAAGT